MDAVAPGLGPDIDDGVARPGSRRIEDAVGAGKPDAHRVDQDVAVISRVELALAADRRHADAIAVAADPGDDAGEKMAGARVAGLPKRSESRIAIGRAPIVNTSRRMPPTPVAAP